MAKTKPERMQTQDKEEILQKQWDPAQILEQGEQIAASMLAHTATSPDQSSPQALLTLQSRYGNDEVRRIAAQGEADKAVVDRGSELKQSVANEIQRARSGGSPLDAGLRNQMGRQFGAGFNQVRVHTDQRSDQISRKLQARAFTIGNDIFFRQGAYAPHSSQGLHTLVHELTHVAQQSGSTPSSGKLKLGKPGDPYEREADSVAARAGSRIASSQTAPSGVVQRLSLGGIGQSIAGLFKGNRSATGANPPGQTNAPVPSHPSGVTAEQWKLLQKSGVADASAWSAFSSGEKQVLLDCLPANLMLAKKLIEAKAGSSWPVDENDSPIYDLEKIKLIDGVLFIQFSDWKSKIKPDHRKDLLTLAAGKPSFIRSLAGAALQDKWPEDENDAEINDADKLKTIYESMKTNFVAWSETKKEHRVVLFAASAKPFIKELVNASIGNVWPKDGSDTEIDNQNDIEKIHEKIKIGMMSWNTIAEKDQRGWLLSNADKSYIVELGKTGLAGKWPQDDSNFIYDDGKLQKIKDQMKLSFLAWASIAVAARRGSLFQAVSQLEDKHLIELARSAVSGIWPKDGSDNDITAMADWKKIKQVAKSMSPAYWNGFDMTTRGEVLAETDKTKRKNIINAANYGRNSEEGALEKAGEVSEHALVDTGLGAVGMTSSILSASKGTGDNPDLDRASGVVGAVGDAGGMLSSGVSFIGNIAKIRRGHKMSSGENYSKAAKEIGKKQRSKGIWGSVQSGIGFVGSAFGFSGNVTKAADPESDAAAKTSGGLGATGGIFGMIGSALGIGKTSASLHSGRRRSSAARKHIKTAQTGSTLTDEEKKLNQVAQFTSKNQNKLGKGLGIFKSSTSFLGSMFSTVGSIAGIFSKETGFAMDILSSVTSGVGMLGGLAQWGAEAKGKPTENQLDTQASALIDLLKSGPLKGADAAKFTHDVLGIKLLDPNDPTTWASWIEEDEGAAKDLIKSKLSKY